MKRFVSIILAFCMAILPVLSCTTAVYAEDPAAEIVTVSVLTETGGTVQRLDMLKTGGDGDLYIKYSDIEKVTRYQYVNLTDEYAIYRLGDKYVDFSLGDGSVILPNQGFAGEYGGAVMHEEEYYLSLSSVLPWLDCACESDNGRLLITACPITYYEVSDLFSELPSILLDDYLKEGESAASIF